MAQDMAHPGVHVLWALEQPRILLLSGGVFSFLFFLNLFTFRERGRKVEREEEKHQCVVSPRAPPSGGWPTTQAHVLIGNQRPFGSQAGAQPTEPHQPGQDGVLSKQQRDPGGRWGWGTRLSPHWLSVWLSCQLLREG